MNDSLTDLPKVSDLPLVKCRGRGVTQCLGELKRRIAKGSVHSLNKRRVRNVTKSEIRKAKAKQAVSRQRKRMARLKYRRKT